MSLDSPSAARYVKYARAVQTQVEIIRKVENRTLTLSDWINMAIELGRRALERDIGARRIAESIYPLVDGSGQFSSYAKISAGAATHLLLLWSGTFGTLRPEEKALLVDVIAELQKLYLTRNPQSPK
ncbi:hypothetical protein [Fodinibius sp.]|uniref:hypothetical protein n=1 Tax=Fodinibius sp. TaxID=1872440 RepID=UPI002ACE5284|nr:hypothetical protein [Fodinibius sp.]